MFKVFILLLMELCIAGTSLYSQNYNIENLDSDQKYLPDLAVKTNLLSDLSTTMNLGGEFRLSDYLTLDVLLSYNPWEFPNNKKIKHLSVQPELRYWIYEPFNGHYLGSHLIYSNYNVGGLDLPLGIFSSLKNYRYRGFGYGLGFSYGYQWILSSRWNLEATFGFGYMYLDYSRYECKVCGKKIDDSHKNYFGPTKVGISLIYLIK